MSSETKSPNFFGPPCTTLIHSSVDEIGERYRLNVTTIVNFSVMFAYLIRKSRIFRYIVYKLFWLLYHIDTLTYLLSEKFLFDNIYGTPRVCRICVLLMHLLVLLFVYCVCIWPILFYFLGYHMMVNQVVYINKILLKILWPCFLWT